MSPAVSYSYNVVKGNEEQKSGIIKEFNHNIGSFSCFFRLSERYFLRNRILILIVLPSHGWT